MKLPAMTPRRSNADPWLVTVVLLTFLICLPFLHAVYWMGDEGVLLNGAERMRHGEILYKDFFEFLPPGGFVLTAAWLNIAGGSMASIRSFGILVITGVACLTYLAARLATRNAPLAAISTTFLGVASQGYVMTQLSHHWLTTLFSMAAFCAALDHLRHPQKVRRDAIIAGLSAGAAVMVTPNCGALTWLAAATMFLPLDFKNMLAYLAASVSAPALLLLFLFLHHDLAACFEDCIRFTGAHYAAIQAVPFGFGVNLQNYTSVVLYPATILGTLLVCVIERQKLFADKRLRICAVFAAAGFVWCYPRPDAIHIGYAAPLMLPLFNDCLVRLAMRCRPIHAAILGEVLTALCLPTGLAFWYSARAALNAPVTFTARGDIAVMKQPGAALMLARLATMPGTGSYFFYPYMPLMSFLTRHEQDSKYDLFASGYTLPSQFQDACLSVMQRADWVVIDRQWTDPVFLKKAFPAMQNPRPPETRAFESALDRGFDRVFEAGTYELRRRNPTASTALCTGIITGS